MSHRSDLQREIRLVGHLVEEGVFSLFDILMKAEDHPPRRYAGPTLTTPLLTVAEFARRKALIKETIH